MEDKQTLTIEKYGFQVKNRYRARGAVLLDTSEGPRLLREYERIGGNFSFANEVKEILNKKGMTMTDRVVPNCEGELITEWDSGEKYIVYEWYFGEDCDYRNKKILFEAAKNLGKLHRNLSDVTAEPVALLENICSQYERHNKEMKHVYGYMKEKKRKNEFELSALSCFQEFYHKAKEAAKRLSESPYFLEMGGMTKDICHGEYNYHNLIVTKNGIATTNFEHAEYGIQIMDLAYFLRKIMEKNSWNSEKGKAVLEGYRSEKDLQKEELEFLLIALDYPVKYWKLLNQYINRKKTWLSGKNMEKLMGVREQENAKKEFLNEVAFDEKIR